MTDLDIQLQEKVNTGTAKTDNRLFEENGYLVIKQLCDPSRLLCSVPALRGRFDYFGKSQDEFKYIEIEDQVQGSVARYWHPQYREIHSETRIRLEKEIGKKLYNTYYYDRFYFPGQKLAKHVDRDACEISVTVHVGTNLPKNQRNWPIWIKTPDKFADKAKKQIVEHGEDHSIVLSPGDGVIYKGCERPHWREAMPGTDKNNKTFYYHQIFFHYVLQDGQRAHFAWDQAK